MPPLQLGKKYKYFFQVKKGRAYYLKERAFSLNNNANEYI